MTQQKHAPFCIRGHEKTKSGACLQCKRDKMDAIKADPVQHAAYKQYWAEIDKRRHRGRKKGMKAHMKDVAAKLLAKADEMAKKDRRVR